jgi:hypothetical protein
MPQKSRVFAQFARAVGDTEEKNASFCLPTQSVLETRSVGNRQYVFADRSVEVCYWGQTGARGAKGNLYLLDLPVHQPVPQTNFARTHIWRSGGGVIYQSLSLTG